MTSRVFYHLSGRQLAALRRAAGANQTELARAAGIGRNTVSYWENKHTISRSSISVKRMCEALGISIQHDPSTIVSWEERLTEHPSSHGKKSTSSKPEQGLGSVTDAHNPAQTTCGARTRKGRACRLAPELGKRRCKAHGGLSTGARTLEGRVKIAEAQQRRWAAWRAVREEGPS